MSEGASADAAYIYRNPDIFPLTRMKTKTKYPYFKTAVAMRMMDLGAMKNDTFKSNEL